MVLAILIVKWSRTDESEYRPLVQDMRLVDAVKIADVLDKSEIDYFSDVKNHMLYVNQNQSVQARIELAKIGIVIEYPKISEYADLHEAYAQLSENLEHEKTHGPLHEQPWFLRVIRLIMGGIIIIVLILSVVRPALAAVLLSEDEK
nr:hypothetical protein [Rheinheimera oceanensis]